MSSLDALGDDVEEVTDPDNTHPRPRQPRLFQELLDLPDMAVDVPNHEAGAAHGATPTAR